MNQQSVRDPLCTRMRQLTRLHPALALVEYDCIRAQLGWTAACSDNLGMPDFLRPLPLRQWLSLFDRTTRTLMWRASAALIAQHSAGRCSIWLR